MISPLDFVLRASYVPSTLLSSGYDCIDSFCSLSVSLTLCPCSSCYHQSRIAIISILYGTIPAYYAIHRPHPHPHLHPSNPASTIVAVKYISTRVPGWAPTRPAWGIYLLPPSLPLFPVPFLPPSLRHCVSPVRQLLLYNHPTRPVHPHRVSASLPSPLSSCAYLSLCSISPRGASPPPML